MYKSFVSYKSFHQSGQQRALREFVVQRVHTHTHTQASMECVQNWMSQNYPIGSDYCHLIATSTPRTLQLSGS